MRYTAPVDPSKEEPEQDDEEEEEVVILKKCKKEERKGVYHVVHGWIQQAQEKNVEMCLLPRAIMKCIYSLIFHCSLLSAYTGKIGRASCRERVCR